MLEDSGSPPSSRSETRRTSRRTTCSSGGRRMRPREVVLLYVESFGNPRRFGRLARRVARRKPILALKSGTSATGQRAASSHTAALAGSEAGVDALFHHAGVTRATSLEELIDVATLLSSQPEPKGRRVAVLTNAGGLGILAADACDAVGARAPGTGRGDHAPLARAASRRGQCREPGRHARIGDRGELRTGAPSLAGRPAGRRGARALRACGQRHRGSGCGCCRRSGPCGRLREAGARCRHELRRRAGGAAVGLSRCRVCVSRVGGPGAWPRGRARRVAPPTARLRSFARRRRPSSRCARRRARALPVRRPLAGSRRDAGAAVRLRPALVPERVAEDADAAVQAAAELGFPAVVKSAAAGAHKTETGGIALDLEDEAAVRAAAERIGFPVIVQPMLRGGVRAARRSPSRSGLRPARRVRAGRRLRRADRRSQPPDRPL